MNDLTQLQFTLLDHVATLTMNAPPVNALTRTLNDELTLALDRISEMDEVRAVMALTGMRVAAPELYRLGIVEACVPPEELMSAALEIARTVASKSPVSTRMGKHTLNVIEDMSLRDGYRYEQDMTAQIGKSDDAKEAQRAFAEKRAPVFTGR